MRRLLIKLVAIETALVGWLSYWIFLVYANNPSVSAGLGEQLTKFPQLAFTTVDIAVMVIIATFAITLAFKFHRGLRSGIRLERALQMLENLMKRNLVLEAQVAELRVEKVEKVRPSTPPYHRAFPFRVFRDQASQRQWLHRRVSGFRGLGKRFSGLRSRRGPLRQRLRVQASLSLPSSGRQEFLRGE